MWCLHHTRKDVQEYDDRFYAVGIGRQPLQKDLTQTEDYYLLTLAASSGRKIRLLHVG